MQKNKVSLKLANLIFLLLTIFINFLANYLPINNFSSSDISGFYKNPFTPAGFTFSIWGIIYFLLIVFISYRLFGSGKVNKKFSTGPYFIIASLANISWIFFWHYRLIPGSMIVILILAVSLFQIFKRLHNFEDYSLVEYITLKLPISLYTAWVTAASIANLMVLIVYLNDNWPDNFLNIAAITGVLLTLVITIKILDEYKNTAFAAVIIWAYLGIISAQLSYLNPVMAVLITAGISILIILLKIIKALTLN